MKGNLVFDKPDLLELSIITFKEHKISMVKITC
jgi:hypothetical protein